MIAEKLKHQHTTIADSFHEVSVLFADIVGFTEISSSIPPQRLVELLNEIFTIFDKLAEDHQIEKIKTIGDLHGCSWFANSTQRSCTSYCLYGVRYAKGY